MTGVRRLAVFAATSGHSGVDRNLRNLIPAFAANGVRVDILRIRGHGPDFDNPPTDVRVVDLGTAHVNTSLTALVRYLKQERPTALLADKDKVNRLALWAKRLACVPTRVAVRLGIHVSTNLADRGWRERWIQIFSIRRFYPWADTIIVPSTGVADDLAALGRLPRERIEVIPNPVLTPQLQSLATEPVAHPWFAPGAPPVVLGVGELSERKDFETLMRAFAQVRATPPARLVILGRGRHQERLVRLAKQIGIEDNFALPGFVTNPYSYMRRAAVFVQSSRFEGFANTVAEALVIGTPVVATDCPSGPREILEDGRCGRLVPVGDVAAMAQAIRLTLAEGRSDRTPCDVSRYTVARVAERYLAALGLSP